MPLLRWKRSPPASIEKSTAVQIQANSRGRGSSEHHGPPVFHRDRLHAIWPRVRLIAWHFLISLDAAEWLQSLASGQRGNGFAPALPLARKTGARRDSMSSGPPTPISLMPAMEPQALAIFLCPDS